MTPPPSEKRKTARFRVRSPLFPQRYRVNRDLRSPNDHVELPRDCPLLMSTEFVPRADRRGLSPMLFGVRPQSFQAALRHVPISA
jgi:hypothetical protein